MNFYQRVYEIVKNIPKGKVTTYGKIAILCGNPKAPRAVGYALHVNPNTSEIPCHRVVNRFGSLSKGFAFGGIERQKILLEQEGIKINSDYCVDLAVFGWEISQSE